MWESAPKINTCNVMAWNYFPYFFLGIDNILNFSRSLDIYKTSFCVRLSSVSINYLHKDWIDYQMCHLSTWIKTLLLFFFFFSLCLTLSNRKLKAVGVFHDSRRSIYENQPTVSLQYATVFRKRNFSSSLKCFHFHFSSVIYMYILNVFYL